MAMFRFTLVIIAALVSFLAPASHAGAQGFMVKPMRMEANPRAGQSIELPLQIRNTAGDETRPINVRLVELTQSENGSWAIKSPDATAGTASSMAWTTLSTDRVDIAPLQPAEIMVRFDPPTTARGAYVVGIIAETPAPADAEGLVVRMRFLIPVIVEIDGRPVRQELGIRDVTMVYGDGSDGKPATTTANVLIVNEGRTFSRVSGRLAVERKVDDRWRTVTRFDIRERSIIPGAALQLAQDLQRRMPTGAYRLSAELIVDGRRFAPLQKEIEFAGDPAATLAYDAALLLDPETIDIDVVPGATRTKTLSVENPGQDPITVNISSDTPRSLVGVEFGELNGQELSAQPWTSIQPGRFTIRPGGRQHVRVVSRVPREGVTHPHYYADLLLTGTYPDGQSAGETRSRVHLSYDGVDTVPNGIVEQMSIAESGEPSKLIVDALFANIGNVHLDPSARVLLLSPQGVQLRNLALAGEGGTLLPLAKRTFSGELDVEGIEPGYYALRARVSAENDLAFTAEEILLVEALDGGGYEISLVDATDGSMPQGLLGVPEGDDLAEDDAG